MSNQNQGGQEQGGQRQRDADRTAKNIRSSDPVHDTPPPIPAVADIRDECRLRTRR